jgi:hypothetical protein
MFHHILDLELGQELVIYKDIGMVGMEIVYFIVDNYQLVKLVKPITYKEVDSDYNKRKKILLYL